jgi:hypothetical protein
MHRDTVPARSFRLTTGQLVDLLDIVAPTGSLLASGAAFDYTIGATDDNRIVQGAFGGRGSFGGTTATITTSMTANGVTQTKTATHLDTPEFFISPECDKRYSNEQPLYRRQCESPFQ